jgi:hypothetical protein
MNGGLPAMKSIFKPGIACLALGAAMALGACASGQLPSSSASPEFKKAEGSSKQLPITDIPIPAGAKLDAEQSMIMGSQDRWIGRIVIQLDMSQTEVFNHFAAGMAKLGWSRTLTVHARVSNQTFQRADRVALIQIEPASFGGVSVWITVVLATQSARRGQV